jgi:hypothetical protein
VAVISFLSDYGLSSSAVGTIKGVMLRIAPDAVFVDLTHLIRPQDLLVARFELMNAYHSFPAGTVHLAVVDPDAPIRARAVAFRTREYFFVGPDNGIFDGVLDQEQVLEAVELKSPDTGMRLFRGRDVFAPAAAALAAGKPLSTLGEPILPEGLTRFKVDLASRQQETIRGQVQIVDNFGNLITNIPSDWVRDRQWEVRVAGHRFYYPARGTERGRLQGQVASHGFVQLVFEGDNCAKRLGVTVGQLVVMQPLEPSPKQ